MAGYVFAIGTENNVIDTIQRLTCNGIYSTYVKSISPHPFEGTLADYASMKEGDNIYFFCKRKFYGIGELVKIGPDCKYRNFQDATKIQNVDYADIRNELLVDFGKESPHYRWLCIFRGAPCFFDTGIDMDEVLVYKPHSFKMLRAFWKLSFIKLGDEENNALKEIFLLCHQEELTTHTHMLQENMSLKNQLLQKNLQNYLIRPTEVLANSFVGNRVKHEMALEANVVYDLCNNRLPLLGKWDYVSHQVVASPFKPIDYMDKIDVLAARYMRGTTIICKYLVIELKKDEATNETIDQVMKYVDWVCNEYAYGDYGAVEACIITAGTPKPVKEHFKKIAHRNYALGSHPVRNATWSALKLLRYAYEENEIKYYDETP